MITINNKNEIDYNDLNYLSEAGRVSANITKNYSDNYINYNIFINDELITTKRYYMRNDTQSVTFNVIGVGGKQTIRLYDDYNDAINDTDNKGGVLLIEKDYTDDIIDINQAPTFDISPRYDTETGIIEVNENFDTNGILNLPDVYIQSVKVFNDGNVGEYIYEGTDVKDIKLTLGIYGTILQEIVISTPRGARTHYSCLVQNPRFASDTEYSNVTDFWPFISNGERVYNLPIPQDLENTTLESRISYNASNYHYKETNSFRTFNKSTCAYIEFIDPSDNNRKVGYYELYLDDRTYGNMLIDGNIYNVKDGTEKIIGNIYDSNDDLIDTKEVTLTKPTIIHRGLTRYKLSDMKPLFTQNKYHSIGIDFSESELSNGNDFIIFATNEKDYNFKTINRDGKSVVNIATPTREIRYVDEWSFYSPREVSIWFHKDNTLVYYYDENMYELKFKPIVSTGKEELTIKHKGDFITGSIIELSAEVTNTTNINSGLIVYDWYLNDDLLDFKGPIAKLDDVDKGDSGAYKCIAKLKPFGNQALNSAIVLESSVINIDIKDPYVTAVLSNESFTISEEFTINCVIDNKGFVIDNIELLHNNKSIKTFDKSLTTLEYSKLADESDVGIYQVRIGYTGVSGKITTTSNTVSLTNTELKDFTFTVVLDSSSTVKEGDKVVIKSSIISDLKPELSYSWYKGDKLLSNTTKDLVIDSFAYPDDVGTYKLVVIGELEGYNTTQAFKSTRLDVDISTKPQIKIFADKSTVALNKDVTLSCQVSMNTEVDYEIDWYADDVKFKTNSNTDDVIHTVTKDTNYHAVIRIIDSYYNDEQSKSNVILVKVVEQVENLDLYISGESEVEYGDTVELQANLNSASGYPTNINDYIIEWFKDGVKLKESSDKLNFIALNSDGNYHFKVTSKIDKTITKNSDPLLLTVNNKPEVSDEGIRYIHSLDHRDSSFIWCGYWVLDEIEYASANNIDWRNPDDTTLVYKTDLKTIAKMLQDYPEVEVMESRHGWIINKQNFDLGIIY